MRIFVIGKSGQLSRSLMESAQYHSGLEIIAAGRPQIDLEREDTIESALRSARADLVINTAAYTAVDTAEDEQERAFAVNAKGAGAIARVAAAIGIPVIQISTDYVFDGRQAEPYGEDASTNPLNAYGRSKLAGEHAVRSANPKHAIVRTSWLYSPFGHNFVRTIIAAADARDTLSVVDDQRGCPSSALDLADGLLWMAQAGGAESGRIWHLAGTGSTSWCGFAQAIMDERRKLDLRSARIEPIRSDERPTRAERPAYSVLDSSEFTRAFGFTMRPWKASLSDVVARLATDR